MGEMRELKNLAYTILTNEEYSDFLYALVQYDGNKLMETAIIVYHDAKKQVLKDVLEDKDVKQSGAEFRACNEFYLRIKEYVESGVCERLGSQD